MITVNTHSLDLLEQVLYVVIIRPGEYMITTSADEAEWYRSRGFVFYQYCQVNDSTLISYPAMLYTFGAAVLTVVAFLCYIYMQFNP